MVVLDLNPRLAIARRNDTLQRFPPLAAFGILANLVIAGPFRLILVAAICAEASLAANAAFLGAITRSVHDL